ncbi:hypothetical protein O6H91_08G039700 [Diphasiastrum complanatum]|uniref:Uncharacterized protein n=1 Tax=Diphasiastrum complanatum TaxID=34168 RepID=A0ACC2CWR2_DIPCM|nr:hypothetical protein O6H91_08G039700 [Diphasiastrum complanatum]
MEDQTRLSKAKFGSHKMRSLWMMDGCKNSQVHAICPEKAVDARPRVGLDKSGRAGNQLESVPCNSFVAKLPEPALEPCFRSADYVESLATIHEELELAAEGERAGAYLEQSIIFKGLGETLMSRRSLRSAWQHAVTAHEKLVYTAWLKYEMRGENLDRSFDSDVLQLECSRSSLTGNLQISLVVNPCLSRFPRHAVSQLHECSSLTHGKDEIVFRINGESVHCNRQKIAALSAPFQAMLNGCFAESRLMNIDFSENGISAIGMKAVDIFSKTGRIDQQSTDVTIEMLVFANKFCCKKLKDVCDQALAAQVHTMQDAIALIQHALEERAQELVASCLKVFLTELPSSLQNPRVASLFCKPKGREQLLSIGHSSFPLYCLLSEVAMAEDFTSDLSIALLCRLKESASSQRQKAFAFHQLGCVLLAKKHYRDAQELFEAAADKDHVYSLAGVARAKLKLGYRHAAYNELNAIISCNRPSGWMFQERALCCHDAEEKLMDLHKATELDPTLCYPYKHRAALLMDEQKVHAAITEINRILAFKVTTDCLELRLYFCLALEDHEGAVRDLRALLTLDSSYMLYSGRLPAKQLLCLLTEHVEHWTKADCWMQLYERWSSVDDIGSLAIVHQMLETDPRKGLLFFRQSLLLLRLNCSKAAMQSLELARDHANSIHEKLVYEGWILYDNGHREEALKKAEESISLKRSFEAFFLKAYALADTSLDPRSSEKVIELLEAALRCPSDGLRKGQCCWMAIKRRKLLQSFPRQSRSRLIYNCFI